LPGPFAAAGLRVFPIRPRAVHLVRHCCSSSGAGAGGARQQRAMVRASRSARFVAVYPESPR